MRLPVALPVVFGSLVLACSTAAPAQVKPTSDTNIPTVLEPTPDIDATVEARVAHERAVDATVETRLAEDRNADAKPTNPPVPQTMGSPRQEPTDTPIHHPISTRKQRAAAGPVRQSASDS